MIVVVYIYKVKDNAYMWYICMMIIMYSMYLSLCMYAKSMETNLYNFYFSARKEKGRLVGQQLDHFIQDKFRAVIKKEKVNSNGETAFELDWKYENIPLCRLSYSLLFKIPKNKFDACSKAMKASGIRYLNSINHQPFKDNHVHDYTFAETEKLFKENVQGCAVVGNNDIIFDSFY